MKLDEEYDSDASATEEQHENLLSAVSDIDSTQRVKAPIRKELSSVVSEFHLSKGAASSRNLVNVKELSEVLKGKSSHVRLNNKIKSVINKSKTLKKPLEKPVAERIKRAVGYKNVQEQLKKWNAIVEKNRVADQLSFPLQQGRINLQTSQQFLNKFKKKTPLEIEMNKILKGEKKEVTILEEKKDENVEFPLTLEEMLEKKKEMAKLRAKLSYQEAKAHRQSKIKSKKYHRILKRDKIKQQLKEFEQLQKTDPEAALKKLEELDRNRAQERASLRHKNTGKWAKNLAVRAKYDKESRKVLAEQLKLSRELTEKMKNRDSDDEVSDQEMGETVEEPKMAAVSNDNPWALTVSSEVTDFVSGFKKYWEDRNKKKVESNDIHKDSGVNTLENIEVTETEKDEDIVNSCETQVENVEMNNESSEIKSVKNGISRTKKKLKGCKIIGNIKDTLNNNKKDNVEMPKNVDKGRKSSKAKNNIKVKSTTGCWEVTEVENENESKRKSDMDLDDLFDDLEENMTKKAKKRLKNVASKIKPIKSKIENEWSDSEEDIDISMKKDPSLLRPNVDAELMESAGRNEAEVDAPVNGHLSVQQEASEPVVEEIDPAKFIEVKPKKLNTRLPENLDGEDNYLDDDDEASQRMNIVEAFDADDVIEEFEEMKKEEEESTKLEMPGELPGWGSWGGSGVKPNERKTKRKGMVAVAKLPQRKDRNKRDMIIREKSNDKAVEHMVKDIPFPFKSVGAFESNLRHPIGREWVPETAHRKFIQKPVETLMGKIIDPMNTDELVRLKREEKSLYRKKEKENKTE